MFKWRKENLSLPVSTSSMKRRIGRLHWEVTRRSRAVDVKDNSNVLKSVMHV